jgi:prolycopene isomerase
MTTYNVSYPEFSPAGTSVVALVALSDGQAWRQVSPARYPLLKQELAASMVDRVAALYPAVKDHIVVLVTSTPVTNMRYTGNVDGAIYGFANTPAQNPAFRMAPQGPLEGLWFAGAWTQPGGSYQTTITCGAGVADAILAEQARRAPRALVAGGVR